MSRKKEINYENNIIIDKNLIKEGKKLKDNIDISENNNKNKDNEKNNNIFRIINKDYEKFIKDNQKFYQYIYNSDILIIVQSPSFNEKEGIKIKNQSLFLIIKQSSHENELKLYLTMKTISETVYFEESSENIILNSKVKNYIKNMNNVNVTFPPKQNDILNELLISKKVFINIFSKFGKDYYKEIFNYLEFIITEISYEYTKTKKTYMLKGVNDLKKFMEKNKIFYIYQNKNDINNYYSQIIPLSNYTIQKIFKFFNEGKDAKYLLIYYKIKTKDFNEYIYKNKKYLNKLINASDIKTILLKYEIENKKHSVKILNQKKLNHFNKINNNDLTKSLDITVKKVLNINEQINNKKKEIIKLVENSNNQFFEVLDISKNIKYINKQYLDFAKGEKDIFTKNIYSLDLYDYNNEKITIMNKNLDNLYKKEMIYVEIKISNKNYLVNKNKLLKIYDNWKIINQEDIIDVIDINKIKIKNNFSENKNEKINIKLLDINIIEHNEGVNLINKNKNKDIIINNNEINIKKNDYYSNEKINIEEKEKNKNEEIKILNNKSKITNNNYKNEMIEYINSLPLKKTYNIKYKVKIERIPKKKHN